MAAVAQLVAVDAVMSRRGPRRRRASTAQQPKTGARSRPRLETARCARGDALLRLALICGVTSWAIMLLAIAAPGTPLRLSR